MSGGSSAPPAASCCSSTAGRGAGAVRTLPIPGAQLCARPTMQPERRLSPKARAARLPPPAGDPPFAQNARNQPMFRRRILPAHGSGTLRPPERGAHENPPFHQQDGKAFPGSGQLSGKNAFRRIFFFAVSSMLPPSSRTFSLRNAACRPAHPFADLP